MKKEELFETLGNLDPGMVENAGKYQRSRRAAWKKWTAAAACAVIIGGAVLGLRHGEMDREFGSPLPVGAKDGYGSLSGICGADDGCTEIHGKRCTLGLVGFVPGVDSKISRTAVGNGCVLSEPDETDAGFRR